MITRRPGAHAAVLALPLALVLAITLVVPSANRLSAQPSTWAGPDSATFEIYQDNRLLGVERFHSYRARDTLVVRSTLSMTGLPDGSSLPRSKSTTLLRRADSSFPIVFEMSEVHEDTTRNRSLNCVFHDTTVVIFSRVGITGRGDAVGLPPGRVYLLEPGIYAQVETLVGDFVKTSQNKRKQPVLIPSAGVVVDLLLTRGPRERLGQGGHVVETTRVELTDKLTNLVAWIDDQGRMWKMEAPGQGLRVERAIEAGPAPAPKKKQKGATKG